MEVLLSEGLKAALGLNGEEHDIAKFVCSLKSGLEAQEYLRSLLPPSQTTDTLVQAIGDQFAQRQSQAVAHIKSNQNHKATDAEIAQATTTATYINNNNIDTAISAINAATAAAKSNRSPKEQARLERKAKKAARDRRARGLPPPPPREGRSPSNAFGASAQDARAAAAAASNLTTSLPQDVNSTTAAAQSHEVLRPIIASLRALRTGNEEEQDRDVRNCLGCGFIYTAKRYDSLARCAFCGNPLGKKADAKARGAVDERALAHKNRLLEFDRSSASRTKVFDDQTDYYEVVDSVWSSEQEREQALEEMEEQEAEDRLERRRVRVTFDIAGRRILSTDDEQPTLPSRSLNVKASDTSSSSSGVMSSLGGKGKGRDMPQHTRVIAGRAGDVYEALRAQLAPWRPSVAADGKAVQKLARDIGRVQHLTSD